MNKIQWQIVLVSVNVVSQWPSVVMVSNFDIIKLKMVVFFGKIHLNYMQVFSESYLILKHIVSDNYNNNNFFVLHYFFL